MRDCATSISEHDGEVPAVSPSAVMCPPAARQPIHPQLQHQPSLSQWAAATAGRCGTDLPISEEGVQGSPWTPRTLQSVTLLQRHSSGSREDNASATNAHGGAAAATRGAMAEAGAAAVAAAAEPEVEAGGEAGGEAASESAISAALLPPPLSARTLKRHLTISEGVSLPLRTGSAFASLPPSRMPATGPARLRCGSLPGSADAAYTAGLLAGPMSSPLQLRSRSDSYGNSSASHLNHTLPRSASLTRSVSSSPSLLHI